jgi:hypothetical protein
VLLLQDKSIHTNMKRTVQNLHPLLTNKKTYYVFLFVYFGFITIPQWFHPISTLFLIWLLIFPVVALSLVVIGISGISGILESKANKWELTPKHISYTQISGVGLLIFAGSITIAYGTHFLYNHQKFDSRIWQDSNSASDVNQELTPRQRMLDDLVENILPGKNKDEVEAVLGKSPYSSSIGNKHILVYVLGLERRLFAIDPEYIRIWFDDLGNFERYEIFNG